MAWAASTRAVLGFRWGLLSLAFAGTATLSFHCGGGTTASVQVTSSKPLITAKTAVRGELAPAPTGTMAPAPTATTLVIPVREQELREGFAARQYFIGCYHEELHRDRAAGGHITLGFELSPAGTLDKLEVKEKTGTLSDAFVRCLTSGVLKVTLKPRPGSEPIQLSYPFSFSSEFHATSAASAKP